MPGHQKTVCPYLGLVHDAATHMNFPSIANQCLYDKKNGSPSLIHQQGYCLSNAYEDCILHQTAVSEIGVTSSSPSRVAGITMVVILLVGSLVFFSFYVSLPGMFFFSASDALPEPSEISVSPVKTLSSPTSTLIPATPTDGSTVTPSPGKTPVPLGIPHVYEVTKLPPGVSHGLLIHVVKYGETLDMIAANYATTVQAIMAVNYELDLPIWADYPIVIPVGAKDTSGLLPFEVYVINDYETISAEALANILAVDAKDLEFYNLCGVNCRFTRGDVLLIPRNP